MRESQFSYEPLFLQACWWQGSTSKKDSHNKALVLGSEKFSYIKYMQTENIFQSGQ